MSKEQEQTHNANNSGDRGKGVGLSVGALGKRLQAAREEKSLSLDKVADDLRILKRHLAAIEREDYDNLPQKAFTRGFVGSYAKYLKLDSAQILSAFDAAYPNHAQPSAPSVENPIKPMGKLSRGGAKKTSFGKVSGLLAVFGLAALGVFLYLTNQKTPTVSHDEGVTTVVDALSIEDQTGQAASQTPAQGQEQTDRQTDVDNASTNAPSAANAPAAQTQAPAVVVDPNAPPSELVFWVRRDTDITVTDQTGAVIMSGTKGRGEHRATGKPPFKLRVNRAANISLNIDAIPQNKKLRQNTQTDGSIDLTLSK